MMLRETHFKQTSILIQWFKRRTASPHVLGSHVTMLMLRVNF